MIIYLEGPDGSGKTTLINSMADSLIGSGYDVDANANRFIPTHPLAKYRPSDVARIDEKTMYKYLKTMAKSDTIYIIDRGPISDIIYRTFDDFEPVTTLTNFIEVLRQLPRTKIIYCHNSKAEEMMLKRGDENPIAIAKHKEISKLYELVFERIKYDCLCKVVDYDFTKRQALNEMIGYINCLADFTL